VSDGILEHCECLVRFANLLEEDSTVSQARNARRVARCIHSTQETLDGSLWLIECPVCGAKRGQHFHTFIPEAQRAIQELDCGFCVTSFQPSNSFAHELRRRSDIGYRLALAVMYKPAKKVA
jgi:hypothetical protein